MQIPSMLSGNAAALQQMRQQRFAKADVDGNGSLNLSEFQQVRTQRPSGLPSSSGAPDAAAIFGKLDADANGELTQSELAKASSTGRPSGVSGGRRPDWAGSQTSWLDQLLQQRRDHRSSDEAATAMSGGEMLRTLVAQYAANALSMTSAQAEATLIAEA